MSIYRMPAQKVLSLCRVVRVYIVVQNVIVLNVVQLSVVLLNVVAQFCKTETSLKLVQKQS
jgi:hypothetical protein